MSVDQSNSSRTMPPSRSQCDHMPRSPFTEPRASSIGPDDHPLDLFGGRVLVGDVDEEVRLVHLGEEREGEPHERDEPEHDEAHDDHERRHVAADGEFGKRHAVTPSVPGASSAPAAGCASSCSASTATFDGTTM